MSFDDFFKDEWNRPRPGRLAVGSSIVRDLAHSALWPNRFSSVGLEKNCIADLLDPRLADGGLRDPLFRLLNIKKQGEDIKIFQTLNHRAIGRKSKKIDPSHDLFAVLIETAQKF